MENKKSINKTVEKRIIKTKQDLINVLKEMPIIEIAVKRVGVSRDTFYRYKAEDKAFAEQSQKALTQGTEFINDMSESQLVALIKDKNYQSISFWLRHNHPKYANKIEISGNINYNEDEPLSPEQAKIARAALRMAKFSENHGNKQKK